MKILAVDTTTNVLAAGLVENGFVRAEYILDHKKAHSQKIMPVIEQILSDTQTDISEIDLFAAANRPWIIHRYPNRSGDRQGACPSNRQAGGAGQHIGSAGL